MKKGMVASLPKRSRGSSEEIKLFMFGWPLHENLLLNTHAVVPLSPYHHLPVSQSFLYPLQSPRPFFVMNTYHISSSA